LDTPRIAIIDSTRTVPVSVIPINLRALSYVLDGKFQLQQSKILVSNPRLKWGKRRQAWANRRQRPVREKRFSVYLRLSRKHRPDRSRTS